MGRALNEKGVFVLKIVERSFYSTLLHA